MRIESFEKIWAEVFEASEKRRLITESWAGVLKAIEDAKLIATPEQRLKFEEIWAEAHKNDYEHHLHEMRDIVGRLINAKVLHGINGDIAAKYRLKLFFEQQFIRWIIDNANRTEMREMMKFINEVIKLAPLHFSDITCQCLWRIILDKFNHGRPFGIDNIVDFSRTDNYGLGFIDVVDFVEFYFLNEERQVCISLPVIVNYAEKIIELNELLAEDIKKQEEELLKLYAPEGKL